MSAGRKRNHKDDARHSAHTIRPIIAANKSYGGEHQHQPSNRNTRELARIQDILRHFDLEVTYGPCVGISRTVRWQRASKLGLHPPIEIAKILKDEYYRKAIPKIEDDLWWDELNYLQVTI